MLVIVYFFTEYATARQDGQDRNSKNMEKNKQMEHIVKNITQLKWQKYEKRSYQKWNEQDINFEICFSKIFFEKSMHWDLRWEILNNYCWFWTYVVVCRLLQSLVWVPAFNLIHSRTLWVRREKECNLEFRLL